MRLGILEAVMRPVVVVVAMLDAVDVMLWPLDRTRASFLELKGFKLITGLTGFTGPPWDKLAFLCCWYPAEPLWFVRGDEDVEKEEREEEALVLGCC